MTLVGSNEARNSTDRAPALRQALDPHYPTERTINLMRDRGFVTVLQVSFEQIREKVHITQTANSSAGVCPHL